MHTLVIGGKEATQSALAKVIRERGHEVVVSDSSRFSEELGDRLPQLIVLGDTQAWELAFSRRIRTLHEGVEIWAVRHGASTISAETLAEAGINDMVSGAEELGQRLPFLEYKLAGAPSKSTILSRKKDLLQHYLDVAGVIFVMLDRDGKVVEINQKGCETLGYENVEIVGKNWFENFLPERLRKEVWAVFKAVMASEEIEASS